jgi:hypothetical protein
MAYTTINKSTDYFNTKLYTGTGATQSITGVGFQPDWVWIKNRSTTHDHILTDAVRGVTKDIRSNNTDAEATDAQGLTAFGTDGFTVGTKANINTNGSNIVSWNWLAGGTGSSNTDGSITSTVSANTTAGFSIVSYTGTGANATVGHGLSSKPKFIIIKSRDKVDNWHCYHESIGATKVIWLDLTSASTSTSTFMQDTEPTSSVFSLGTNTAVNTNGFDHIAYCFAEKKGFSKFGSYAGNGNVDGTFVYTGFKPAWVMIKDITAGSYKSWSIFDTTRQTFNVNAGKTLYANQSYEEGKRGQGDASTTIPAIDMLSNGFKCRVLNDEVNTTSTYIYMAIGQSIVGSNNIPATAR